MLLDRQEEEVVHVICVALQAFPEVRGIQCAALRAINCFLTDNGELITGDRPILYTLKQALLINKLKKGRLS